MELVFTIPLLVMMINFVCHPFSDLNIQVDPRPIFTHAIPSKLIDRFMSTSPSELIDFIAPVHEDSSYCHSEESS